ncbi:MAG: ATP-binding protein [Armatimonadetes bacterium]|nr:ATP-binding protein [Armatimonadota bacterium]
MSGLQLKLLDMESAQSTQTALQIPYNIDYTNAEEVLNLVREFVIEDKSPLVLDLAEVSMIDSSGLKALLQAKRLCDESRVEFKMVSISKTVARMIGMSGFGPFFGLSPLDSGSKQTAAPSSSEDADWKTYERQTVSDPSVIAALRRVVLDAAQEQGIAEEVICDIQIAVGEALTNAYRHGSPVKGESKIKLLCMVCSKAIVIEIMDEGKPFDPCVVSTPDPAKLMDHGMGIYLMRQAMDVVEFDCDCPGNRVRMIRWLSDR